MLGQREKETYKVTIVGSVVNLLLVVFKFIGGVFGYSAAMIADAIHSLSDFGSDVVVLLSIKIANKPKDKTHKYGHGKYETFATMFIGLLLFLVAIGLTKGAITKIIAIKRGETIVMPTLLALIAALLSIVSKEILYWYTLSVGKKQQSPLVVSNAWHHRSDAFSSVATAAGIGAILIFGPKYYFLDPLVCVLVSVLIALTAWKLFKNSFDELCEKALPEEIENEILEIADKTKGVEMPHNLQTRKLGISYIIDLHIIVDAQLSVKEAHKITMDLERSLREKYGEQTQVTIHIEEENHE